MRNRQIVRLTLDERAQLLGLISAGRAPARKLTHARILLKADCGPEGPACTDEAIAQALEVGEITVWRVRKRYVEEGLEAALTHRHPKNHRPRRLDGDQEAHLIALACSEPPEGRDRWTLRLLAGRMVELEYTERVSYETVRVTLKKTRSSHGSRNASSSPRRRAASSSGAWRTRWTYIGDRTIPAFPRSVWTRHPSNCSPMCGSHCR